MLQKFMLEQLLDRRLGRNMATAKGTNNISPVLVQNDGG